MKSNVLSPVLCISIFCFSHQTLPAQNLSLVPDSLYLDKGEAHQDMQQYFQKMPHSYFVFVMNTGIMEGCSGTMKNDYRFIKQNLACQNIFFVLNEEGGITEKTLERYMTEIFELEYNKAST